MKQKLDKAFEDNKLLKTLLEIEQRKNEQLESTTNHLE